MKQQCEHVIAKHFGFSKHFGLPNILDKRLLDTSPDGCVKNVTCTCNQRDGIGVLILSMKKHSGDEKLVSRAHT